MEKAADSLRAITARASAHARWRVQRAATLVDKVAIFDTHRDPRRSLYISSWQRSGSTWLAEIVASAANTRLIYEPANVRQLLVHDAEPRLVAMPLVGPGHDLGDDGRLIDQALRGKIHDQWSDQLASSRLPDRRVIKDVRTMAVLPWIADRYPDTPLVALVRHPMAVAHSLIELGWFPNHEFLADAALQASDPALVERLRADALLAEVALWAAHHRWALSHPATDKVLIMFYEELVSDPVAQIERLAAHVAPFHPTWAAWVPDLTSIERPSSTSFRGARGSATSWIDTWSSRYDEATLDVAAKILAGAGLSSLYAGAPMPLVTGADARHAILAAPPGA